MTHVDDKLLDAGPTLKVIGRLGVGLERFDLPACASRNVAVVKADGANAQSVGEYVVAMAASLLRIGGYQASADVASGAWPRQAYIGREMSGRTLGVIGLGQTGRNAASRAKAMGMQVVAYDPYIPGDDPVWSLGVKCEGVADDSAVAAALRAGHLGGAAIDVFAEEPLTGDAGALYAGLANVILTPHIAGVTDESNARVSKMTAEKVLAALS